MSVYHKPKKRSIADKLVIGIVALIALVIISLSFKHTAEIAKMLDLPPAGIAFIVEILFAALLFLRAKQRALQLNVPLFLHLGYFAVFLIVTGTNMYGLSIKQPVLGPIFGVIISGSMWLMENVLVWLWTASHEPHQKSPRELMREAKQEIKEEKIIQKIEWMKWEAKKPDLKLIKKARAAEEERKKVVGDGLPEFFRQEIEPVKKIVAELEETKPRTIDVQEPDPEPVHKPVQTVEVAPMRQIGFHVEPLKPEPQKTKSGPAPLFQPNLEARAKAIQTAKQLKEELGRLPKKRELIEKGLSEYYAKWARQELKNQ